jgi:hypothetical protein
MMRKANLVTMGVAAFVALGTLTAVARAADPNGTWKWKFMPPNAQQEVELSLTLKAEGEKLTGKLKTPFGEADVKDGTFKNGEVNFITEVERNGNTFKSKYKGKVEGDTIKGKVERERNGETVSRDWEAKREK